MTWTQPAASLLGPCSRCLTCLRRALLAGGLLLGIPGEVALVRALRRLDPKHQNECPTLDVRVIGAGIMEDAVMVDRRAPGGDRAGDCRRGIDLVHLQAVDAWVVIDRVVGCYLMEMAAR